MHLILVFSQKSFPKTIDELEINTIAPFTVSNSIFQKKTFPKSALAYSHFIHFHFFTTGKYNYIIYIKHALICQFKYENTY